MINVSDATDCLASNHVQVRENQSTTCTCRHGRSTIIIIIHTGAGTFQRTLQVGSDFDYG